MTCLFFNSSAQSRVAEESNIDQCVAEADEAATDENHSARRLVIFKGTVISSKNAEISQKIMGILKLTISDSFLTCF